MDVSAATKRGAVGKLVKTKWSALDQTVRIKRNSQGQCSTGDFSQPVWKPVTLARFAADPHRAK